jgi:hypothetical protein
MQHWSTGTLADEPELRDVLDDIGHPTALLFVRRSMLLGLFSLSAARPLVVTFGAEQPDIVLDLRTDLEVVSAVLGDLAR